VRVDIATRTEQVHYNIEVCNYNVFSEKNDGGGCERLDSKRAIIFDIIYVYRYRVIVGAVAW